jgi:multidrug efflux system outer membrane protein
MKRLKTLLYLSAGLVFLMGGCSLAPKYSRPAAPVPAAWPAGTAHDQTKTAAVLPTGDAALHVYPWQDFFPDPKLRQVIKTALENNRDLRMAALNAERARAYYGIQRASLLPSVNAVASESKQRIPADLSASGKAMTAEQYSVNFGVASWEIDFFGRIRNLKDQALEEYLATDQARLSAQLMLLSTVANAYLALAADREGLQLALSTLETVGNSYRLQGKLHDLGVVSALDLRLSQTQVDAARGEVSRYAQLAAQDKNALNLLAGTDLPETLLPDRLTDVEFCREISPGLSSTVLLQRPDVLAAEHRLKGAHANIGAARAAFFPRISLTAALGTASADLSGLFNSGQGTWSFAPVIAVPVFDARTWHAYDVTKVEQQLAVAQYEKTIQTAFREVADALAVQGAMNQRLASQQSLAAALAEALRLSTVRYTNGIDSYLNVLDAQRSLYNAKQGFLALQFARLANEVTLYKALGGAGANPDSPKMKEEK